MALAGVLLAAAPGWLALAGVAVPAAAGLLLNAAGIGLVLAAVWRAAAGEARLAGEHQRLARQLADAQAAAAAGQQELDSFTYAVSHDLRAPLRTLDGFASMLAQETEGRLGSRGEDFLTRIRGAVRRMNEQFEGLLVLSRVTRSEVVRSDVDLSALAEQVVAELREGDPDRPVKVSIAPGLRARADAVMMKHVLHNLLANAWKFTSRQPAAEIRLERREVEGRPVFVVADNGAGFDMRYAERLFGAFQRLHPANDFPGLGTGLAAVRRIVLKHGGRVWAEAKPGEGATFFFTLDAGHGGL